MCDPVSLTIAAIGTTAILGFAASNAQYQGQEQQAQAQVDYQVAQQQQREVQIQENYDRTLESYHFQLDSEQVRLEEVRKSAAQQVFNVNQASLEARSTAAARAASTGAAGQSTYLSLLNYITKAGVQVGGINTQFRAEEAQSHRNRQAIWMQARDRASSIQPYIPAPVQGTTDTRFLDTTSSVLGGVTSFGLPLIRDMGRANSFGTTSTPALGT